MSDIRTIVYPTPSEEEIRSIERVKEALSNPNIKKLEEGYKLSLRSVWEQMGVPAELEEFTYNNKRLASALGKVVTEVLVGKYYENINNLIRDYPWLDEDQVYKFVHWNIDFKARVYKDYIFVQDTLFRRGVHPYQIVMPDDIYVYNLRYVDQSERSKLYELVEIERSENEKVNIENILGEIYNIVASDDLDFNRKLKDYKDKFSVDFDDEVAPYLGDLCIIVAERMIQANLDSDLTDRLLFLLNQIDHTNITSVDQSGLLFSIYIEPYLDLLKMILYRINDPIVAIDIIQDEKAKYKNCYNHTSDIHKKVKGLTDDYLKDRLKIENPSKRNLLKYVSNILHPDRKILK